MLLRDPTTTAGLVACFPNLVFLDLAHNEVCDLGALLRALWALLGDRHGQDEVVAVGPRAGSLRALQCRGNPCALLRRYRAAVLAHAPASVEALDGVHVSKEEARRLADSAREGKYDDGDDGLDPAAVTLAFGVATLEGVPAWRGGNMSASIAEANERLSEAEAAAAALAPPPTPPPGEDGEPVEPEEEDEETIAARAAAGEELAAAVAHREAVRARLPQYHVALLLPAGGRPGGEGGPEVDEGKVAVGGALAATREADGDELPEMMRTTVSSLPDSTRLLHADAFGGGGSGGGGSGGGGEDRRAWAWTDPAPLDPAGAAFGFSRARALAPTVALRDYVSLRGLQCVVYETSNPAFLERGMPSPRSPRAEEEGEAAGGGGEDGEEKDAAAAAEAEAAAEAAAIAAADKAPLRTVALGYAHLDLSDFLEPEEQVRMGGGGALSARVVLSKVPPHLVPIDVEIEDPSGPAPAPAGEGGGDAMDAEVAAIAGIGEDGGIALTISVQWNQV